MMSVMRKSLRSLAYRTPVHRWLGLGALEDYDKAFWDEKLAGEWKPYLGGTISVEARNAIVLALIRIYAPQAKSLLDMGCASGSLFRTPGGEGFTYTGVDISDVAIRVARQKSPAGTFHASSIQDFQPADRYDVIVFGDVLYYLMPEVALEQVARYASHLNDSGIVIVSMKRDAKSKVIFRLLRSRLTFVNGIIYQEKIEGPDFKLREDSKRPAYLVTVFNCHSN